MKRAGPSQDARGSENSVTVEEKHPEVRTLINLGKERGYLLYDEIYQALPEELANAPDELDEIYIRFGDFGIEVVDVPEKATKKAGPAAAPRRRCPTRRPSRRRMIRSVCTCARWAP